MCRLYAFSATEPTKVECTLVHAQNALLSQSASDATGKDHSEGWGVATFSNGVPVLERQAWAAYDGQHFQRAAAKVYARTVLAHVRRATVGQPSIHNTHPFVVGEWAFAHNGTVPGFSEIRAELVGAISPDELAHVKGQTDSEHVFALLRTEFANAELRDVSDVLSDVAHRLERKTLANQPGSRLGLNILLTRGGRIWGTRWGRTLYAVEREGVHDCEICGFPHIHHSPRETYWACVVASEPISHEPWTEIPDRSVWCIDPDTRSFEISPA